jgi:hypothetical protein
MKRKRSKSLFRVIGHFSSWGCGALLLVSASAFAAENLSCKINSHDFSDMNDYYYSKVWAILESKGYTIVQQNDGEMFRLVTDENWYYHNQFDNFSQGEATLITPKGKPYHITKTSRGFNLFRSSAPDSGPLVLEAIDALPNCQSALNGSGSGVFSLPSYSGRDGALRPDEAP